MLTQHGVRPLTINSSVLLLLLLLILYKVPKHGMGGRKLGEELGNCVSHLSF